MARTGSNQIHQTLVVLAIAVSSVGSVQGSPRAGTGTSGGQQDPNPGGGVGGGEGFGPIIDGCFLLMPPDGPGLIVTAPSWPYPEKHEELNIEQKIELFGDALLDPGSMYYMGKREIKRQLREFRAKNYPAASYMTTAPSSDELDTIKEIRKPAWNEPGGWGFEGFGPEGAAYELIAVAAGGSALAMGKVRGGPAPQHLPTALVPEALAVTPPFRQQILRELNDGVIRPRVLRDLDARVIIPTSERGKPGDMRHGDVTLRLREVDRSTNAARAMRGILLEIESADYNVISFYAAGWIAPNQVKELRAMGFEVIHMHAGTRSGRGSYMWRMDLMPGLHPED